MPDYRFTANFIGADGSRFSEVYYRNAASLTVASDVTVQFVDARLNLLQSSYRWAGYRVAETDGLRKAVNLDLNLTGLDSSSAPRGIGAAAVCNLVSSISGKEAKRKLWLRGIAQNMVLVNTSTGFQTLGPGYTAKLVAWFTQLQINNFEIYGLEKPVNPLLVNRDIVSIDGSINKGYSIIAINSSLAMLTGDLIKIGKVNSLNYPGINRIFKILDKAADEKSFTIKYDASRYDGAVPVSGTARSVRYLSGSIIDWSRSSFGYLRTRDTQANFSRSRGRQRAKIRVG